ncbi:MAG: hypothetical protein ACRDN9_01980, partial [Streptosporangiaceae bacterium]
PGQVVRERVADDATSPAPTEHPGVPRPADAGGPGTRRDRGSRPVAGPRTSGTRSSTPQARPRYSGLPLYKQAPSGERPLDLPAAASGLTARLPAELQELFRRGVIEALAIVLLGLGGLLRPIPVWFIGAILLVLSREWSRVDKLIAGLTPGVAVLVGGLVVGTQQGGLGGFGASILSQGWMYFKVGAVLGAMYLGWRSIGSGGALGTRPYWRYARPPRR